MPFYGEQVFIFFFLCHEEQLESPLKDLAGLSSRGIMVMLLKFIICISCRFSYSFSFSELFSLVHFRVRKV